MLFHTYLFIFAFLPATLFAFFLAAKVSARLPIFVLIAASLVFYAYWMPQVTLLLLGSILFNYFAGLFLQSDRPKAIRRAAIIAAIATNLGLLGYFKYANFFMGTVQSLTGWGPGPLDIILPIGISFYTFTQIAYLVDSYKGEVKEPSFTSYVLFVTFFPHLLAGGFHSGNQDRRNQPGHHYHRHSSLGWRSSANRNGCFAFQRRMANSGNARRSCCSHIRLAISRPVYRAES
jgi:D-alanyl-lipoteichoic acid acyltransferase DltB (MBOAT superfamily)